MKRQRYSAAIFTSLGDQIGDSAIAYAHNSGVRASEKLVREYARAHGVMMHGGQPHRDETGYARIWKAEGHEVIASVIQVTG